MGLAGRRGWGGRWGGWGIVGGLKHSFGLKKSAVPSVWDMN